MFDAIARWDTRISLAMQGGAMTPPEATAFAADPRARDAAELRRADEAAKVIGLRVSGLDVWIPALRTVAAGIER